MRSDMAKVITERPRVGGYSRSKSEARKTKLDEDGPKHESMRKKWLSCYGGKKSVDLLGPMHGYILGNVGRPWNKVRSEIAAKFRGASMAAERVFECALQMVAENVSQIIGNQPYDSEGKPIYSDRYGDVVYVGRGGILCRTPVSERSRFRHNRPLSEDRHTLGADEVRRINGIWYLIELVPVPHNWFHVVRRPHKIGNITIEMICPGPRVFDVVHKCPLAFLSRQELLYTYGRCVYGANKRQLNSREIKRFGLSQ